MINNYCKNINTLKKRHEFLSAWRGGIFASTKEVVVQAFVCDCSDVRVGFTASKKVGNAVARNRSKRRMREVARVVLPDIGVSGVSYVLIARPCTKLCGFNSLIGAVKRCVSTVNRKILNSNVTFDDSPRTF